MISILAFTFRDRNQGMEVELYFPIVPNALLKDSFVISLPWNSYVESPPFPMVETSTTNRSPGS